MTRDTPTLTEIRALRAYIRHGSAQSAAEALGLAESTVKGHLANIRSKLGVHTTAQAVFILHDKLAA